MIRNLLLICAAGFISLVSMYGMRSHVPPADFSYVNPSGIHTLDPARMSWTQDFRVALNIWEGLTTWDAKTVEPIGAAAHFPPDLSSDAKTYTFTIRDDARWSNGDPVRSADFVRGWRRGMEPGTAADYVFLFTDHIVGAEEYVTWRREGSALLTALRRLADGWSIESESWRAVLANALVRQRLADSGETAALAAELKSCNENCSSVRARLARSNANWAEIYDQVFETHVGEMAERFTRVGIGTPDDRTLIIHLKQPCPFFCDLTAFPVFLPCHDTIETLRERFRESPITAEGLVVYDPQWTKPDYFKNGYGGLITNGPYHLCDWSFKSRLRMSVNPHHRLASAISCRTVDMLVYENISAAIMAYEAGGVDFLPAMDVPYDHEIARLSRTKERPDFHLCQVLGTYFLNFNCASKMVEGSKNPFIDARVRRAFSLAVDKRTIVENVLARGDRVAHSFVPPSSIPGYSPPPGLQRDVETARDLLVEAGFAGGNGMPPVTFLYTPADERICQALARTWEELLGVQIELLAKESRTFAEDKANQRFMIARGNWFADYNDPTTFLDCLTTGNGNNDSGYSNPRYDELLREANRAANPQDRAALLKQAEAIIVEEDFPILPILHYATPIAIKPYVKGLYPNARLWFPFHGVRIER